MAFFNPYFQVSLPSRYHDPAIHPTVGRPIDACYETTAAGNHASGWACDQSTDDGQTAGVTFDNPGSVFNGADHFVDINANQLANADGPEVWYTDAFGRNGQTGPFPGSIRHAAVEDGQQDRRGRRRAGDRQQPELRRGWGARAQLRAGARRGARCSGCRGCRRAPIESW